ncbi:MAG: zinc ribbon domain-containing protein [Actinomycetales bacterium]|nr:zinc ribbon domain-containing protein [Candidatus Phosphoribacter baldrii]
MTYVCPNGHDSTAADFCDTCGAKIDATQSGASSAPEASAAPPPTNPGGLACPNCGTENVPESLFCEACGYDFTTGAMPRGTEGSQTGEGGPGGAAAAGAESPSSGMPSAPPAGVALAPGGAAPGEGEGAAYLPPPRRPPRHPERAAASRRSSHWSGSPRCGSTPTGMPGRKPTTRCPRPGCRSSCR